RRPGRAVTVPWALVLAVLAVAAPLFAASSAPEKGKPDTAQGKADKKTAAVKGADEKKDDKNKPKTLSDRFDGMQFRCIGPYRGGRSVAVTGVRHDPLTYYFGGTGGGVWKSTDAGATWEPISDKEFKTGSVGAIAVAESDPNVIYVGMGESPIRGTFSGGDGVWKSTDAGRSWTNVGLAATRQISRVRVHPSDPDLVYAAALGHASGPNEERGVFRSQDGGRTWKKVLYVDDKTG